MAEGSFSPLVGRLDRSIADYYGFASSLALLLASVLTHSLDTSGNFPYWERVMVLG